jgi:dihydrofolate reductase
MSGQLAIIVATSLNGGIGVNGELPWHIPEDLKYFRRNTVGHAIVMGRRTYDSIGRPLPKRRNIVITRQLGLEIEGCEVAHSLDEALALAWAGDAEPRVIGGATLYELAMPLATRLFLTEVQRVVEADTFFPDWSREAWTEVKCQEGDGVRFLEFERQRQP